MPYIMPRAKLEVGTVIHEWTLLSVPDRALGRALCRWSCGREKELLLCSLLNGSSTRCKSCGTAKGNLKHGESGMVGSKHRSRLFHTWRNMLYRCSAAGVKHYPGYYDCGVRVCDAWASNYQAFRDWALANGYRDDLSIDRWPDQRGGYSPDNCRWATSDQQLANRRTTVLVTAFGEAKPLSAWGRDDRCRVSPRGLHARIAKGWDPEEAISTPRIPGRTTGCSRKRGRGHE